MNSRTTLCGILGFVLATAAHAAISGRIVDGSGGPIAGAFVELVGTQICDTSDAQSAFSLVVTVSTVPRRPPHARSPDILGAAPLVRIDLFRLDGARTRPSRYTSGSTPASGLVIVRNSASGHANPAITLRDWLTRSHSGDKPAAQVVGGPAKARAVQALRIAKQGYRDTTLMVAGDDTDLGTVVLSPVAIGAAPWLPGGPAELEHRGEMVKVRAKGYSFMMGSDNATYSLATPPHRVGFTYDFWIDTTEVTQRSYEKLLGVTPWEDYGGNHPGGTSPDRPTWFVNWYDAAYYCNARSKAEGLDTVYSYASIRMGGDNPEKWQIGKDCELENVRIHYDRRGYRLPTEAEWEYACRGGTTGAYYWDSDEDARTYARFDEDNTIPGTVPVASLKPNAYGLYDMSGNVSEWCNDWLAPYPSGPHIDPIGADTSGTSPAPNGWLRAVRGGGWRYCQETVASFIRGGNVPHNRNYRSLTQVPCMENNGSDDRFGFRCVLVAP